MIVNFSPKGRSHIPYQLIFSTARSYSLSPDRALHQVLFPASPAARFNGRAASPIARCNNG